MPVIGNGGSGRAKPPQQSLNGNGGISGERSPPAQPTCATIKECQFRRVLCTNFTNATWAFATADELDESLPANVSIAPANSAIKKQTNVITEGTKDRHGNT